MVFEFKITYLITILVIIKYIELPFEIRIFEYSFVIHVKLDIRIWL
jgi:hypothetical protein